MSEDRELDRLAERLDRAFQETRPRPGLEAEVWERIRAPRRRRPEIDRTQLGAVAAVFLVVLATGFGLSRLSHGGSESSSSAPAGGAAAVRSGTAAADTAAGWAPAFGRLPRPLLVAGASPPLDARPATAPAGAAPVLPPRARVFRYAEPDAALADGFASARGAQPASASATARVYQASGFTLAVLPTNDASGVEASYVVSPRGVDPVGGGPPAAAAQAAAQRFLDQLQLAPPAPNRVDVQVQPNLPTSVRFIPQLDGADVVTARGTPAGLDVLVKEDGSVLRATGPLPLALEPAVYPLAPMAQLVRQAGPGYTPGPLVYVLALEGGYGYLEPAVLFTGPGRTLLLPAVDPGQLR